MASKDIPLPMVAPPPAAGPQALAQPEFSWGFVANVTDPFVGEANLPKYGREHWLTYFWMEAVGRCNTPYALSGQAAKRAGSPAFDEAAKVDEKATTSERKEMVRIFSLVFQRADNPKRFALRRPLDQIPDDELRGILTSLLLIGHRGVPLTRDPSVDASPDNIISYASYQQDQMDVGIGWRSETRPWWMVRKQGGAKRQVDVWSRAEELKLLEMWHPFFDRSIRKTLWFREGKSGDNCLYSVISVGLSFKTVTGFPKIDDPLIYSFPRTAVSSWDEPTKQRYGTNLALVTLSNGTTCELLATKIHTYIFLLKGLVLDTEAVESFFARDPFPERGVESIPLDNIYAAVPAIRVHHAPNVKAGHTVFVEGAKAQYAFTEEQRKLRYKDALEKLDREFRQVLAVQYPYPAFSCAWSDESGTGTANAGPIEGRDETVTIRQIVKFPSRA
jgi:hypothetical protein